MKIISINHHFYFTKTDHYFTFTPNYKKIKEHMDQLSRFKQLAIAENIGSEIK